MRISREAMERIHEHAAEGYPHEICGMLIANGDGETVTQVRRVRNTNVERARDRYLMDPRDQIRIEREADDNGWSIVGYYHTHPDHPAWASETDARWSWAGPVYLIVSCRQGRAAEANAFRSEQDGGPMHQEPLEIV